MKYGFGHRSAADHIHVDDRPDALRELRLGVQQRQRAFDLSLIHISLLVVQATLSVVLVAGATMLGRSLNKLEHQDFGFQVPGRVEVAVLQPSSDRPVTSMIARYRQLEDTLNHLPGIQSADLAMYNPLTDNWGELIMVAGHPPGQMDNESGASWDRVGANYLQDLGVPVIRGRYFSAADNETTAPVAVVNQAFVKRFFKNGEDPIDQHFGLDVPELAGTFRIVGICLLYTSRCV